MVSTNVLTVKFSSHGRPQYGHHFTACINHPASVPTAYVAPGGYLIRTTPLSAAEPKKLYEDMSRWFFDDGDGPVVFGNPDQPTSSTVAAWLDISGCRGDTLGCHQGDERACQHGNTMGLAPAWLLAARPVLAAVPSASLSR
jgi:hypothetical protein